MIFLLLVTSERWRRNQITIWFFLFIKLSQKHQLCTYKNYIVDHIGKFAKVTHSIQHTFSHLKIHFFVFVFLSLLVFVFYIKYMIHTHTHATKRKKKCPITYLSLSHPPFFRFDFAHFFRDGCVAWFSSFFFLFLLLLFRRGITSLENWKSKECFWRWFGCIKSPIIFRFFLVFCMRERII